MGLLIFLAIVFVLAVFGSLAWFYRSTGPSPPTQKQRAHIARLKQERNADDLADIEPSTVEGASWLIARPENRSRRKGVVGGMVQEASTRMKKLYWIAFILLFLLVVSTLKLLDLIP